MFGRKRKSNIKKQVRKRYKALKKSGDVKLGKEAGLSKKEMKEGIRKNIAEKGVLRRRNVMAKKALDNIAKKESSVATSKDMATERSNRSAERQSYMQSKADAANKDIRSRKAIGSENERIRANKMTASATKPGDTYEMIMRDGTKKMVMKPEAEVMKTKKNKAMYGAKVKVVKKAKNGGKITDPPKKIKQSEKEALKNIKSFGKDKGKGKGLILSDKKAEKGAALKSVPSKAKGLSKLPKGVRNKMGYMQDGGKVNDPKKKIKQSEKEALKNIKNFGKEKGRGKGLILSSKKAMYGASMKKKAMYGAKMKKKK